MDNSANSKGLSIVSNKHISQKAVYLTFGYIRPIELLLSNRHYNIISLDIKIIIALFYDVKEGWFKGGKHMTINGAIVTHNKDAWQTTYGIQEVSNGKHEWKIKVHNCRNNWMCIGISANTNHLNSYIQCKDGTYVLWGYDSTLYAKGISNKTYANGAAEYGNGDTITVHLDLDKSEMSFSKNGNNYGIAFKNIAKTQKYRLAIGTYWTATKFEMISYKKVSNPDDKSNCVVFVRL